MLMMAILAIVFTVLANRSRSNFFRVLSFIFWAISVMVLFTAGWFWLAILFPAVACIVFWKNNPRTDGQRARNVFYEGFGVPTEKKEETVTHANGNDVIDLDDVHYRPMGNAISIKKLTGNTKIIVPDDVAVILDITVGTGIVKVFDESPQINAGNIHYFSDNVNEARKRMKITIRVQTGNVEIVRG
ncbi:hypothetical protein RT41_GL000664 [Lactococcus fujiensis JCM 16395]|uniref:Cell wall-active antibiotics response LiaF-like C-terminal domain-containing protein n=2 Tax=Lactococcus fujiensis TaxID=610251 RepID=A0A2A5RNF6_9LACT|nr:hypothetical protein RT41_GL000664 [Lactococcus fujiensis JCM 16395]